MENISFFNVDSFFSFLCSIYWFLNSLGFMHTPILLIFELFHLLLYAYKHALTRRSVLARVSPSRSCSVSHPPDPDPAPTRNPLAPSQTDRHPSSNPTPLHVFYRFHSTVFEVSCTLTFSKVKDLVNHSVSACSKYA